MSKKCAILIAGPTASGKSETALKVAEALNGAIINADSMQVYKGLPLITALPDDHAMAQVPHHLYGFRDPAKGYSVADWLKAAQEACEAVNEAQQIPIFVGGTGLYLKGLVEGIANIPDIPEHIKLALNKRLDTHGLESLYQELILVDKDTADRLKPNDKQRILRALSVYEASGQPLSYWQSKNQVPVLEGYTLLKITLQSPPEDLNERIMTRLKKMVDAGALDEAKAFSERYLAPHLPLTKALALRPFILHKAGNLTLNEALEKSLFETRRYAKRQRTWFRNQFADWHSVKAGPKAADDILTLAKAAFQD
jgi:tRNA dimethylallyltransferase